MTKPKRKIATQKPEALFGRVVSILDQARGNVVRAVNTNMVLAYWLIGREIVQELQGGKGRAEYGKKILSTLSTKLTAEFGSGYDAPNLSRMIKFAECYPDPKIVVTLSQQLSWSHFIAILPVDDDLARDFYAEMCRIERWSVRTLRAKIGGMLFERTALSKKPEKLVAQELQALREDDILTPDMVFRDHTSNRKAS